MSLTHRRHRQVVGLLPCLIALSGAPALADDGVSFRDLARRFANTGDGTEFASETGMTEPPKHLITVDYKVLLVENGRERPVDPKMHQFKVGDKIKVRVESYGDYYIYVFFIGASGASDFLLPVADEQVPLLKKGEQAVLPDDGYFEFTEPPGQERLLVVATEEPIGDLKVLAAVLTKKPGEPYSEEEKEVQESVKGTRPQHLKSVKEREQEVISGTVMHRSLEGESSHEGFKNDVRTRDVKEGTIEEVSKNSEQGTVAIYFSLEKDKDAKLLVNIPLVSVR